MKNVFLIILSLFILTACTSNSAKQNISRKQALITAANSGDVSAMLELNTTYLFPETKEGYDYYVKWYDDVLHTRNTKAMLLFANVYKDYMDMFINGRDKYFTLLETAAELGNDDATFILLDAPYYSKNHIVEKQIIKHADERGLLRLLAYYDKRRDKQKSDKLKKILISKGYKTSQDTKEGELDIFKKLYSEKDKNKFNEKIQSLLSSSNPHLMLSVAEFLDDYHDVTLIRAIYERLIVLDDNNADYYHALAHTYLSEVDGRNVHEDKIVHALKKAALLDDYESTQLLIEMYTEGPDLTDWLLDEYFNTNDALQKENKYKEAFAELKTQLADTNESKRALAEFYFKSKQYQKANKILDQLAQKGNQAAMFNLVSRLQYDDSNKGSSYGKKWANYILDGRNPALIVTLSEAIEQYDTPDAQGVQEQVDRYFVETKNMSYLKKLAKLHQRKNPELERQYLLQAGELGDVSSYHKLALKLIFSDSMSEINEALAIYEQLADRNDTTALVMLGKFYDSRNDSVTNIPDVDKAIMYYEKVMELGDTSTIERLMCLYFCRDSVSPEKLKEYEQKAYRYVNQLAEMQVEGNVIRNLGRVYYQGYNVEKNLQKAVMYFIKAAEAGYVTEYKTAAMIYKDELNNEEKYLFYLNKGLEERDGASALELGRFYDNKNDLISAVKYYQMGVDYNNSDAALSLGFLYEVGKGVRKDIKHALFLYEKAYSLNRHNGAAAFNLALIYHFGKGGIEKDFKLAEKWYLKSDIEQADTNLKRLREQQAE